jgi:guanosine-3',5'-bis(diphosphate) 3'-pyrophosphohydrolase
MVQSAEEMSLLLRAASFAAERHRNQRRKDAQATSYINHPLAVAAVLADEGGVADVQALAAALLHDTLEDTDTTPDELRALFGDAITGIVQELSDDKALPKAERKRLQIEHAPGASPSAKLVKLGDKICNLRDIAAAPPTDWPVERRREYFDWAAKVVAGCRGTNARLEAAFDPALENRP